MKPHETNTQSGLDTNCIY